MVHAETQYCCSLASFQLIHSAFTLLLVLTRLRNISPLHGIYRDKETASQLGSEALVAMLAGRITVKVSRE
jgi:hypothetical protein